MEGAFSVTQVDSSWTKYYSWGYLTEIERKFQGYQSFQN